MDAPSGPFGAPRHGDAQRPRALELGMILPYRRGNDDFAGSVDVRRVVTLKHLDAEPLEVAD